MEAARLGKAGLTLRNSRQLLHSAPRLQRGAAVPRRQAVVAAAAPDDAEKLRQENEQLRKAMAARLAAMSPEQRSAFVEQHNRLRATAKAAGVEIPPLAEDAQAAEQAPPARAGNGAASSSSTTSQWPAEDAGRRAIVEQAGSSGLAQAAATRTIPRPASSPGKPEPDSPVTFNFDSGSRGGGSSGSGSPAGGLNGSSGTAARPPPPQQPSAAAAAPAPAAPAAEPTGATSQPPSAATPTAAAAVRPGVVTPAANSTTNAVQAGVAQPVTPASPAKPAAPAAPAKAKAPPGPPPPPPIDWKAEQEKANKEVDAHDPREIATGRETWLYYTIPAKPTAGAKCVVYFNRWQSEPLRHEGRLQLHMKYNTWEVEAPEGDRLDMPHEGRINRAEGTDYYSTRITIPENAYEMNFVVSNGDGKYDNNGGQNFLVPVNGPMTKELWLEKAPERAEAAWRIKQEEEERKAKEAEEAAKRTKEDWDQRKAEEAVNELKREHANWQNGAVKQELGRWRMLPALATPGSVVKVQYNRMSGPFANFQIPEDQQLKLRIGHNGWKAPQDIQMQRLPVAPESAGKTTTLAGAVTGTEVKEEWWEAQLTIPKEAACLNFVMFYHEHCDNNERRDFKALVDLPPGTTVDDWASAKLPEIKKAITEARLAKEAEDAAIEAERKAKRRAAQAKAEAVRRTQQKHVLFATPEKPKAGGEVTVFYNPNNGGLPGRQRVWIKGGWNRWRHPRAFGPMEMTPPTEGEHFSITLSVPHDAYYLDFVFTDAPEYGEYDSNFGLDFHLPVEGSLVSEPPLHVVHIAVEMAPICKVGGLGDVVTALGRAVQDQGHQVEVILPRYNFFMQSPLLQGMQFETEFDWNGTRVAVTMCYVEGLRVFFIEPRNNMFSDGGVYVGLNDGNRFEFFCKAAMEFLLRTGRQPDILHCHDWSTSMVAKSYWQEYHAFGLWKPRVVFTIHNMEFGEILLGEAAFYSQRFTTVSPSYAWEIGSHPGIAPNAAKLRGVRNGIDIDIWNPETDAFLPRGYTSETVVEGKRAARAELRKRFNLSDWGDKPVVGVVSRLTKQKGTHLIAHACFRTLERGGQFVLLGSAPDPKIAAEFDALANSVAHGQDAGFAFTFDEPLSHLIYAGCDIIVVPSMFEPCGLTQMIAMRYGAVPVVRQTGGLKDTIFDVDNDKARAAWEMEGSTDWQADNVDATNGFSFEGTDDGALDYALNRALDAYYNDRAWWHSLQKRVMEQDWSWNKPAHDYIELYYAALK